MDFPHCLLIAVATGHREAAWPSHGQKRKYAMPDSGSPVVAMVPAAGRDGVVDAGLGKKSQD